MIEIYKILGWLQPTELHVALPMHAGWIYRLACTRRDNDTLVAIAHTNWGSLQRLVTGPLRLEHIATSLDIRAHWLDKNHGVRLPMLFRGELLVVADYEGRAIVSFRATNNALTERQVLFNHSSVVRDLTLAGDRLVLADTDSNLHVYDQSKAN